MESVTWDRCRNDFVFDGALIDILVLDADEVAWESFLTSLKSGPFEIACYRDGEQITTPESVAWVMKEREQASLMLSVLVDGLTANCHFFGGSEIELDIDPQDVANEAAFEAVLKLMRFVAHATALVVVATPEGSGRKGAFLTVQPDGEVAYKD
jgi:hypothetical protein